MFLVRNAGCITFEFYFLVRNAGYRFLEAENLLLQKIASYFFRKARKGDQECANAPICPSESKTL